MDETSLPSGLQPGLPPPGDIVQDESVWPQAVARMVAELRETGLDPLVCVGDGKHHVCVIGSRVWAIASYRIRKGKARPAGAELLIDGEPRAPAQSPGHMMRLWAQYEKGDAGACLVPIGPVESVPGPLRRYGAIFRAKGTEPGYAFDPRSGHWYIGFDFAGGGLRFGFERGPSGAWTYSRHDPLVLVVNGEDKTEDVLGSVAKALTMAMSAAASPNTGSAVGASAGAPTVGSGKGTVMRN